MVSSTIVWLIRTQFSSLASNFIGMQLNAVGLCAYALVCQRGLQHNWRMRNQRIQRETERERKGRTVSIAIDKVIIDTFHFLVIFCWPPCYWPNFSRRKKNAIIEFFRFDLKVSVGAYMRYKTRPNNLSKWKHEKPARFEHATVEFKQKSLTVLA